MSLTARCYRTVVIAGLRTRSCVAGPSQCNVMIMGTRTKSRFRLPRPAMLNGLLTGATGQINGTTSQGHNVNRVGVGTGVYSLGAPRQIEFGLRLTF